jgi:hypothetical protein
VDTQKRDVRMQNTRQQNPLGQLWSSIQSWLFPVLEDEIGALDDKHRQFVAVCELCAPQDHIATYRWCGNGCPPSDRLTRVRQLRLILAHNPLQINKTF